MMSCITTIWKIAFILRFLALPSWEKNKRSEMTKNAKIECSVSGKFTQEEAKKIIDSIYEE
jgi:hypothetical protein